MKLIAFTVLCATAVFGAETYKPGPDSLPQAGVPKGLVTRHELAPGKFYPGTPHNYALYIPAHYDASKPNPYMIFLDGGGALNGLHVPTVFDNLIAKGELPPIIGIFVDPGVLPVATVDAQNRYERIFEYDSTSDRYSRFLLEELIPEVAKGYNLSKSPDDHAIEGVSTGAVGAFVAAWNRPDQFHRVLTLIGTFVDMKGAEELPSLIRKTEPKPIRILLQDGRNDHLAPGQPWGVNFGGSWPINNQVMYDAFEFAGYDAKLVWGDGAHDTKQGSAMMPDALLWLWAGYPSPIVVREPAVTGKEGYEPRGRVYSIISADHPWEQVGGTYDEVCSPAAGPDGSVYFSEPHNNRIYKSDANGQVSVFKEDTGGVEALQVAADGRLYAAQSGRHRLVSYSPDGVETVVAAGVDAARMTLTEKGDVYYIDNYERAVRRVDHEGKVRTVFNEEGMSYADGIGVSADQAMVYLSDGGTRYAWSLQIAADGGLVNAEPFYRLYVPELRIGTGAHGATADSIGQVYFATALGIQVTEQNGRVAAILNPPEIGAVSAIAFGGTDLDWIYAAEGGKLFRRSVKIHGTAPWKLVKPPKPPL